MRVGTITRPSADIVGGYKDLLEKYRDVSCALSDCMGRFNAMSGCMRPLFEGIRLAGTAVTVKTLASDIGPVFKAVDLSQPGDIVVIDARGSVDTAFWGENVTLSAMNKGIAAAVIDGATRDVEEIRRLRFPILCRGIVPNAAAVTAYGQVNVGVQCAGVQVNPGDIILIDGNGVVCVPQNEAETILEKARFILGKEHIVTEKLQSGQTTIGELVGIDKIAQSVFDYQVVAADKK